MAGEVYIVVDFGSTRLRATALDSRGSVVAEASYKPRLLRGDFPFILEYDPEDVARGFAEVVSLAHRGASAKGYGVRAVALTAQRVGAAFLDRSLSPVYVGPNVDARGFMTALELSEEQAVEAYRETGFYPPHYAVPGRLQWFRENRPGDAERVSWVLTLLDWLTLLAAGVLSSELSSASGTMLLDVARRSWSTKALELFGVDPGVLPELREAGLVSEELSAGFAGKTGLPLRTPVVVCGGDTHAGLLAAGGFEPGALGAVAGTTCPVMQVAAEPAVDARGRTWTSPHVLPGLWVVESNSGRCGYVVDWFLSEVALRGGDYEYFDELAMSSRPGACGVRVKYGVSVMNAMLMGRQDANFYVRLPEFSLQERTVSLRDVARGVVEAVVFSIRANADQAAEVTGLRWGRFGATGGLTRLRSFRELLPSVLRREVVFTAQPSGTALGCLALTLCALGEEASPEKAVSRVASFEVALPVEPLASEYENHYYNWLDFYKSVT